jgi:phage baseplate assembly protein W
MSMSTHMNPESTVDLVGTGFAFPPVLGPSGTMAMVSGTTEIEQAIWLILATAPGERPMRPEFGCGIHELLFSPVDATTAALVERDVREALVRWEPRIDVVDVKTRVDPVRDGAIEVQLVYAVKDTHDPRSLVFPFYVIPPE